MKKGLSRMVANRRGTNPGGGAVRVSPGVYRQPIPRPVAPKQPQMAPPMQAPQGQGMGIGGFMQNQIQPQQPMQQQGMAIPRPIAGQGNQGGGYGTQVMPNTNQGMVDKMQQAYGQQGKQWIRG